MSEKSGTAAWCFTVLCAVPASVQCQPSRKMAERTVYTGTVYTGACGCAQQTIRQRVQHKRKKTLCRVQLAVIPIFGVPVTPFLPVLQFVAVVLRLFCCCFAVTVRPVPGGAAARLSVVLFL